MESCVTDATALAQFGDAQRSAGVDERLFDALIGWSRRSGRRHGRAGADFKRQGLIMLDELEGDRSCARCGAMFAGQGEIPIGSTQIQVRVSPSVELGGCYVPR